MILAQTGFSANARTISVSNEMLKEVINISR
jgi:flagellar hook protein FlgE